MKTGVQSITIRLIEPEAKDTLQEILDDPWSFHGKNIDDEGELDVSGRRFAILEREGEGTIGPWTRIKLTVDATKTPIDMLIALDTSYSMITTLEDASRFDLAVDGIVSLIGRKAKKLIVGIMAYGVDWEMALDMTNAKSFTKKKLNDIRKELGKTKHKGKAAAGTALNGASEVFTIKGLNDLKIVVLLSDGADEIGPNPIKEADKLNSRGIYIYPFYFGEEKDQKSLTIFKRIAAKSHTELFSLYNAAEQEKRRLIRASLKSAEEESGDETGTGSGSISGYQESGEDEGKLPEQIAGYEGETEARNGTEKKAEIESENEVENDIGMPERTIKDEGDSDVQSNEGKEGIDIPSGSELLTRELRELGSVLPFIIQEGGKGLPSEDDGDVPVIKAGMRAEEVEGENSSRPILKRTPKIFDAVKNFIEWVKGLIW